MRLVSSPSVEKRKRPSDWMKNTDAIRKLLASDSFPKVIGVLQKHSLQGAAPTSDEPSLQQWLFESVLLALSEPPMAETMTRSERRKVAQKIRHHSQELQLLLEGFQRDDGEPGIGWPFRAEFSQVACRFADQEPDGDWVALDLRTSSHLKRARLFAIRDVLGVHWQQIFTAINAGADLLAEKETLIKKPGDRNARRLYFLRTISVRLMGEFGSPCRAVALALASIYYDCSDLDEAAVSKLAPVTTPVGTPHRGRALEDVHAELEVRKDEVLRGEFIAEMGKAINLLSRWVRKLRP